MLSITKREESFCNFQPLSLNQWKLFRGNLLSFSSILDQLKLIWKREANSYSLLCKFYIPFITNSVRYYFFWTAGNFQSLFPKMELKHIKMNINFDCVPCTLWIEIEVQFFSIFLLTSYLNITTGESSVKLFLEWVHRKYSIECLGWW